jgi:hypothetical protein
LEQQIKHWAATDDKDATQLAKAKQLRFCIGCQRLLPQPELPVIRLEGD